MTQARNVVQRRQLQSLQIHTQFMMQGICLEDFATKDFFILQSEMTSGHNKKHEQTGVREKDYTE